MCIRDSLVSHSCFGVASWFVIFPVDFGLRFFSPNGFHYTIFFRRSKPDASGKSNKFKLDIRLRAVYSALKKRSLASMVLIAVRIFKCKLILILNRGFVNGRTESRGLARFVILRFVQPPRSGCHIALFYVQQQMCIRDSL